MDDKLTRQMLKLAMNRNATIDQLMAGIALMDAAVAADNARRVNNPPPPLPTQEEQLTDARRRASANLAKLRRR